MTADAIRYTVTGKKGNRKYRLSYRTLQTWGYQSLVNRYYRKINPSDSDTE